MSQSPIDRPYIQAWLKRVERQLRGSGRISQIALTLSQKRGGNPDEWSRQLRDILEGLQHPSAELIADAPFPKRSQAHCSAQETQSVRR